MVSIRSVLDTLDPKDRALLMYAFENGIPQVVKYNKNQFIGVNVAPSTNLSITQSAGLWSVGVVNESGN